MVRLQAPGVLRLSQESIPEPAPGEALVRLTAVGLCGSDLHWFLEGGIGDARLTRPLVLGHEFAGVIESGARRGERVAADPAIPCRRCPACRDGNANLCEQLLFAGHGATDGALRGFMTWPEENLHALPDEVSDAEGALLETLGVALHALDLGHVRLGMTVGVFGLGPVGLLLVRLARLAGASSVLGTDPLQHRREMASALGGRAFAPNPEGAAAFEAAMSGGGVEVAFEAAGEAMAVDMAVSAVRPGGRVVLVGIPSSDRIGFTASVARRKGLTLAMSRRMKDAYPRAIGLAASREVDLSRLVTHTYPMVEIDRAFERLRQRDGVKVMIDPAEETPTVLAPRP